MKLIPAIILLLVIPGTTYAGNLDLLYNGSNGQGVESYTMGVGFSDDIASNLDISGYYRNGKTNGIVTQDKGEIGLNYNPEINDRWSFWFDERFGYDKILGVEFENDFGGGLKYYLYKQGETNFSLSSGVLYQFTSTNCDDLELCNQGGSVRYSHRAKFNSEAVSFVYFYQPNMYDSSDYITKFKGDVRLAKIKDNISVLFHYKNEYRSLYGRSEENGIKLRIEY